MRLKQTVLLIPAVLSLLACGKKASTTDDAQTSALTVDSTEAVVESGITAVSGIMDESSGSSFASNSNSMNKYQLVMGLLNPSAQAASCSRPYYASCNSSARTESYSSCTISGTSRTLTGSASLSYSNSSCLLTSNGDTVTRTYDLSIVGPRGGTVTNASSTSSDYTGASYGGGGRLTKTASGYDLDILGKHKSLTYNSKSIFNISIRTLSTMQVTGGLSRSSRTLNGGQLQINHNLAKFTATIVPTNLQYSNTCCHPISGSLALTYSGSKTGSATITFSSSCGVASKTENGQSSQVELSYCE